MDRTIKLNDLWYIKKGDSPEGLFGRLFNKPSFLPVKKDRDFCITRKIICPKQINDTVTVFFEGDYASLRVYAGKTLLRGEPDGNGHTVYNITPALKTGKTCISAYVPSGEIRDFYLSVKRDAVRKGNDGE